MAPFFSTDSLSVNEQNNPASELSVLRKPAGNHYKRLESEKELGGDLSFFNRYYIPDKVHPCLIKCQNTTRMRMINTALNVQKNKQRKMKVFLLSPFLMVVNYS